LVHSLREEGLSNPGLRGPLPFGHGPFGARVGIVLFHIPELALRCGPHGFPVFHDGPAGVTLQRVATSIPNALRIEPLLEHPQHVPFVAGLVYREFWAGVPDGLSETYLTLAFGGKAEPGRVLKSWLALESNEPLGCVHLIDNDDDTLPQLHPWLAAMVVVPHRRGQGIGSALVRALLRDARGMGLPRVWFGTDGPGFYERLGARRHLQRSTDFWTMVFELDAASSSPDL
jgi:predicted N-acetyltransferase YhbS